jgi:hypothetical protein
MQALTMTPGYMFGKGVYFADVSKINQKSDRYANHCSTLDDVQSMACDILSIIETDHCHNVSPTTTVMQA